MNDRMAYDLLVTEYKACHNKMPDTRRAVNRLMIPTINAHASPISINAVIRTKFSMVKPKVGSP